MAEPRTCDECNRTKARHLWLAKEYVKKGPAKCKSCYKKSDQYAAELDRRYQRDFGITLAEYDVLLADQDGRCFVCLKKPGTRRLAVDHDHSKEELGMRESVRGLLCRDCNEYIGHIEDDPIRAALLRRYLTRPTARERNLIP